MRWTEGRRWRVLLYSAGVLAAVVIAASVSTPCVWFPGRARRLRASADVQRLTEVIETFRQYRRRYPTTEEGIALLVREGFLRQNAPDGTVRDPWDRVYLYARPGIVHPDGFDVWSYGRDGVPGGHFEDGDIRNE